MKPKMSKRERTEFAKRMVRRFFPGAKCRKNSAHWYIIQVPTADDSFFEGWIVELGAGNNVLKAWESALYHHIARILSSMHWRGTVEKVAELKTVYFGFGEADAQAIKDAPDCQIIGIDEWVEDMKKAPGI